MLTNPSTCGLFDRKILEIAAVVHEAGGLLYYDGANLNALLGRVRPGDMGFDVMHVNLHKTFATPHGGGGPGAGPICCNEILAPFMPVPLVKKTKTEPSGSDGEGRYFLGTKADQPNAIGRLSSFAGNTGILMRAYAYALMLGDQGFRRVSAYATLNANYLAFKLKKAGFTITFWERKQAHEFVISVKDIFDETGVRASDFSKRLLDFGFHSPTTYFPLMVPECLLIEPTETETPELLDKFIKAMIVIKTEAYEDSQKLKNAPYTLPATRVDEVTASRKPDLKW